MNFLLVIYSCKKYIFMNDYYSKKYKELGYDIIFVFADPNLEEDVDYIYDKENNMAVLKCNDNFESLSTKTYYLFKMILNSSRLKDYDYIIKMDDDTEFNVSLSNLNNLHIFDNKNHYIGPNLLVSEPMEHNYHFGKCYDDMELNITPFELKEKLSWGMGFFYILSREAIQIAHDYITENDNILNDFLYEDMMIGKIMKENNIEYLEYFTRNIITDLKKPRISSLNSLINNNNNQITYNKISYMPKTISKIRKVTFNFNKNENNDENKNIDDELSEKIKKEVTINQELDKKIRELSEKVNNSINNKSINSINNKSSNLKNNNINKLSQNPDIKMIKNPILNKSAKKINTKIIMK